MNYLKGHAESFVTCYKRTHRECERRSRIEDSLLKKLMISNMSKWLEKNHSKYIHMLEIVEYFNRFPGSKMYQPQDMVIPPMPQTPKKVK